jgi:uncharacterized protein
MNVSTINATKTSDPDSFIQAQSIAISGANGLVGTALKSRLKANRVQILNVTRRAVAALNDVSWDPAAGVVDASRLNGADAFVHLAGENIATSRWTAAKRDRIRESRVEGTRIIAESLAALSSKPSVMICASAIGFYGNRGEQILDETAAAGDGFLADVCRDWESATRPAIDAGIRVVHLRIGVIISRHGGALPRMLMPFRMGVGGRVGSGRQYWSWISLEDVVGAIEHCLAHPEISGPVNCVTPTPVTNLEFTKALGRVLSRPTILPMPAFAAKLALGQMAEDLLLTSARVIPERLMESGYTFRQPELVQALQTEIRQA